MPDDHVLIIGAGIGGLAAAIDLAGQGFRVSIFERSGAPGGKMRRASVGGLNLDAGPTVLTLRDVFDALFADAGGVLEDFVALRPADVLARHAWSGTERLDLFADTDRTADAIGTFAGAADARGFLAFSRRSREIFETLDNTFMRAQRPNPVSLVARTPLRDLGRLMRISPFATLWSELGRHFRDPRLRQLFGRYATYCGASPFAAPATLMLVAHAEQNGVWLVEGGMHRLAEALARLAGQLGATIHYGAHVEEILVRNGRAVGIALRSGEQIDASCIVANVDAAAISGGFLGQSAARGVAPIRPESRSLSAVTFLLAARPRGFSLAHHNVIFSRDYEAEFRDIFERGRIPENPTVYVCAQDRDDQGAGAPDGAERLLCLVNAPPVGDRQFFDAAEIERCQQRMIGQMDRCGLQLEIAAMVTASPSDFDRLYPATGGALYGMASHGWTASFRRPGARTKIPGLYLAGGSAHPGPGVPMAAMSGRLAAHCVMGDLASTRRFHPAAMRGGMSMRSATTAPTG
ncbi:MAG: phytoene desaturase [Pseudorhodoplanes sp.]|nr:phytoene desaturase [Pseudorhodoplanes sp.]